MCASGYIPAKFDTCTPAPVVLCSLITKQVPEHAAVHIQAVHLDGLQNLPWVGKLECFPGNVLMHHTTTLDDWSIRIKAKLLKLKQKSEYLHGDME